jgi:ABC-type antimicrobial peptide transport system permease subunit
MAFLQTTSVIITIAGAGAIAVSAYYYWFLAISLFVATVGIVNSMLMSVTERYKEIGTMKCLGAMDRHIVEVFLFEALILGVAGGIVGTLIGFAAALGVYGVQLGWGQLMQIPGTEIGRSILLSIGIAILLSIAGAVYPAYYAARLKPVEALRYEL